MVEFAEEPDHEHVVEADVTDPAAEYAGPRQAEPGRIRAGLIDDLESL